MLTKAEIQDFEKRIQKGDFGQARRYTEDVIRHDLNNRAEIHRRRMLMARSFKVCGGTGNPEPLYCFALLSVLLDDMEGWNEFIKFIGPDLDPAFGFKADWFLRYYKPNEKDVHDRWHFLLEASRKRGHIPAKKLYWDRQLSVLGPLKFLLTGPISIWYASASALIALRNPDDRRLAYLKYFTRRQR